MPDPAPATPGNPPDTPPDNPLGDLTITDPRTMRALAHPVRLAVLDLLRRDGPASATDLARHVDATPSTLSWHLRHLAAFGLVRDSAPGPDGRHRRWELVARGFRFEVPDDTEDSEGNAAARALAGRMLAQAAEIPTRWAEEVEPHLEPRWRHAAGFADSRLVVDPDELAEIERAIEQVLAPYANRGAAERPPDSRTVRVLRYLLPDQA